MRKGTLEKIIARGPTNAPLHIMVSFACQNNLLVSTQLEYIYGIQHGHPMIDHPKNILAPAHDLGKAYLALQRRL